MHPHPLFKSKPNYEKKINLIDPDLGPELKPPQLKNPPPKEKDDEEDEEEEADPKKEVIECKYSS